MKYRNESHNVLAFYGLQGKPEEMMAVYHYLLDTFVGIGLRPRLAGLFGREKLVSFRYAEKLLAKSVEQLRNLSVYFLPMDVKNEIEGTDVIFSISADTFSPYSAGDCIVDIRNGVVASDDELWTTMARTISDICHPAYGIRFDRLCKNGPYYFALGMLYGTEITKDEILSNHHLNIKNRSFLSTGQLSSVFPWNLLTSLQLNNKIEGMTLKEWIERHPDGGSLSNLTDEMMLWQPPVEKVPQLCRAIQDAGLAPDWGAEDRAQRAAAALAPAMSHEEDAAASEQLLGQILDAFGYDNADDVSIARVEEPGRIEHLDNATKLRIQGTRKPKQP